MPYSFYNIIRGLYEEDEVTLSEYGLRSIPVLPRQHRRPHLGQSIHLSSCTGHYGLDYGFTSLEKRV